MNKPLILGRNNLQSIFDYYNDKHNLQSVLNFDLEVDCHYDFIINKINMNVEQLKAELEMNIRRFGLSPNINEHVIFVLLHEIKHNIEWKINSSKCIKESNNIDDFLYHIDTEYHDNVSFEKRASKFAKKEIIKWKNF